MIPLLSFYLFLREMRAVPPVPGPVGDRWPGVAVTGLALAIALLGNLVQISDIVFYALIVWVAGLVLVGFGWARGLVFWPSVLHLVFMLPLPQFLYWKVNTSLQLVSSVIGVEIVRRAGVPVFLDGNVIDLGVYKLMVAEACSGLRYLFPIMSFSYVFAVLYRGPLWHRLALLAAAAPIAVMMNAVRIGIIGVLVDRYGIAQAEGFLHVFEGWAIFLASIALLFGLARLMQRLSGDRRPLGEALDLDFAGLGAQLARVRSLPVSAGAPGDGAADRGALGRLAARPGAGERSRPSASPSPASRSRSRAGRAPRASLAPGIAQILAADDYLTAVYRDPAEAAPVDLFLSWYASQTAGAAIHSPAVCLPGAGWEVSAIEPVAVALPGTAAGTVRLNRAVIQKGLDRQLVYYWFEGRGRRLTNDFAAKFHTLADSLTRGRTDGGLVRLITPIGAGGEAAADARLQAFLAATVDTLPRFLPE